MLWKTMDLGRLMELLCKQVLVVESSAGRDKYYLVGLEAGVLVVLSNSQPI